MYFPKYSFVVPVLNGELTIHQCLTSILNQTLNSFEVIVIDNGSTDKTTQIIQSFSSVKYFLEPRKGRSIARNRGIEIARGEYVAFVDCDVILERDWLFHMDQAIKRFPMDVVGSQIIPSREPKNFLNNFRFLLRSWETSRSFLNVDLKGDTNPTFNTAAGIISRKSLLHVGGFNEKFKRCEDAELAARLLFKSFIFGGTTKARAKVIYGFTSYNSQQLLLLRYLIRIFANTLYHADTEPSFSLKLPRHYEFAKKLFRENKFALSIYSFLYLLTLFAGKNIFSFFKKKYPVLKLESGHHELLSQFSWGEKTYILRKGVRFYIQDDQLYLLDKSQYVKLAPTVRDAIFRVYRQEEITMTEINVLEGTKFFYSF